MDNTWEPTDQTNNHYEGRDRNTGALRWRASRADLVFGSNSQLRAIAEVYAQRDGGKRFVTDFVKAWVKVMELALRSALTDQTQSSGPKTDSVRARSALAAGYAPASTRR